LKSEKIKIQFLDNFSSFLTLVSEALWSIKNNIERDPLGDVFNFQMTNRK
jgi:ethanolamine utilization microcompartment shell protein EutS